MSFMVIAIHQKFELVNNLEVSDFQNFEILETLLKELERVIFS